MKDTRKEGDRKRNFSLWIPLFKNICHLSFSFSFYIGSFENEVVFAWFMLGPRKINISFRFNLLIDKTFIV